MKGDVTMKNSHNTEDLDAEGIIYCIRNLINNKMYIGQSKHSYNHRYHRNIIKNTHNIHLRQSIQKYGKINFEVSILAKGIKDHVLLDMLETELITVFDLMNSDKGYNKSGGGYKPVMSDEVKKKRSDLKLGALIKSQEEILAKGIKTETLRHKSEIVLRYFVKYIKLNNGTWTISYTNLYKRCNTSKLLGHASLTSIKEITKILESLGLLIITRNRKGNSYSLHSCNESNLKSQRLELLAIGRYIPKDNFYSKCIITKKQYSIINLNMSKKINLDLMNILMILSGYINLNKGKLVVSYSGLLKIYNSYFDAISISKLKNLVTLLEKLSLISIKHKSVVNCYYLN
jgi:hypothetical protein